MSCWERWRGNAPGGVTDRNEALACQLSESIADYYRRIGAVGGGNQASAKLTPIVADRLAFLPTR